MAQRPLLPYLSGYDGGLGGGIKYYSAVFFYSVILGLPVKSRSLAPSIFMSGSFVVAAPLSFTFEELSM